MPWFAVLLAALTLTACGQRTDQPTDQAAPRGADRSTATVAVHFHDAKASEALHQRRADFQHGITAVLEQPDASTLKAARQYWSALYNAFNHHYLHLAIRACAIGKKGRITRLDGWPSYPAYVDSLPGWPDSGIVNDPTLQLDATVLRQQQGATDGGEIALGFQPLWQLLAGVEDAPRQPGDLLTAVNENIERRRAYLKLAAAQLESDLSALDTNTVSDITDVHCALSLLDDRLNRLAAYGDANDAAGGLYLAAHSAVILRASQPASALTQLTDENNTDLRMALDKSYPGFQDAVKKAANTNSWKPIKKWLTTPPHPASPLELPNHGPKSPPPLGRDKP